MTEVFPLSFPQTCRKFLWTYLKVKMGVFDFHTMIKVFQRQAFEMLLNMNLSYHSLDSNCA